MPSNIFDNPFGNESFLAASLAAALEAGEAIREVYRTDFQVAYKQDHSPLTLADRSAHDIIVKHLSESGIPILSEEGRAVPFQERNTWKQLWIVDPLDGTKEFVNRNGEFTVNIALVREGTPVMGVVYAPDRNLLYFAMQNLGAYKISDPEAIGEYRQGRKSDAESLRNILKTADKLPLARRDNQPYTIVGSRSHATPELEKFIAEKRNALGNVDFIPAGSSLKICLVAEGRADIYPRLGPTMEWDTAAGHAVAIHSGARIHEYESGNPLVYNKETLLNPWFIVEGLRK